MVLWEGNAGGEKGDKGKLVKKKKWKRKRRRKAEIIIVMIIDGNSGNYCHQIKNKNMGNNNKKNGQKNRKKK